MAGAGSWYFWLEGQLLLPHFAEGIAIEYLQLHWLYHVNNRCESGSERALESNGLV